MSMAAAAFSCGLMAQENRASAGLELALPMGDFGDAFGMGFGASIGYELPVGDNLGVMAQVGYLSFAGKDIEFNLLGVTTTIEGPNLAAIPVQVGAKYYFTDNQEGAYLGVLTGLHFMTVEDADGESSFGLAPLLGYMIGENIDISLRYQMLFDKQETVSGSGTSITIEEETVTNSYLGIRAAYMFGSR